jgi:hypothetical protein
MPYISPDNPFRKPQDLSLALAWERGRRIGKRRELSLVAIFATGMLVTICWFFLA